MNQTEIIEKLKHTPTSDLCDSMRRLGISGYMKGISCMKHFGVSHMAGRALTIEYVPKQPGIASSSGLPGQFAYARMCTDGQILVIDAKSTGCWVTGGNACRVAELSGAGGVVVDGCMRDLDELSSHDLPVYCLGGGTKAYSEEMMMAAINSPVNICGCRVEPGDLIVGDNDGIVVIPYEHAEAVLYQAEEIAWIETALAEAVERQASLEELNAIAARKPVKRP